MLIQAGWGERLRDERKRLRMNQEVFAQLAGVSRGTQKAYELESTSPDVIYLSKLESEPIRADVIYILTGTKQAPSGDVLDGNDRDLINKIRSISEGDRILIKRMVELAHAAAAAASI